MISKERNPPTIMISKERNPRASNKVSVFTNKHMDRERAKYLQQQEEREINGQRRIRNFEVKNHKIKRN